MMKDNLEKGILLISCPDKEGIVSAVSTFLFSNGANIIHSDQHSTDPVQGHFFMRIEFSHPHLNHQLPALTEAFEETAKPFEMEWSITVSSKKPRLAIFATKEDHCLQELLWRWQLGELHAEIAMVISNHLDFKELTENAGIPFYHVPITKESKLEATSEHLRLLKEHEVDTVILARYMQIIPEKLIHLYHNEIINIHHSFLPAFIGGNPYQQAFDRGVKLIGATAHYVNAKLDEGPIIEQDITRITHRYNVTDLKRHGKDIERIVLYRAVKWHLEKRVIVHGNKTIVFQ
ncbi:formyltetrahydrofolate deformylase [Bacillus sp. RAR_GA_16]|uniref:formyltetrahydrofolate deformylase n=1 Tax=Bacillus sp. RAR_GA_16 TaxID=2876774 RepID=UPI001CCFE8A2|nr:formyltetrahydrofolate deformylase [Bacillus sp. RAR_GA_16]MCA0172683.1 formyltetrahydrofolate deformylase [Bacillus sp. RAR_GA_16]